MAILSRPEILANLAGRKPRNPYPYIVIDPFDEKRLDGNSYDVSLGQFYFRARPLNLGARIYNPYCEEGVDALWGKSQEASVAEIEFRRCGIPVPEGISPEDRVIIVKPMETILAHTGEFIGGRDRACRWMQGKSGWSRSFISVCMDAGLGDIGFISRWTMEITNRHPEYAVPLVVGRTIAKIAFLMASESAPAYGGNYQQGSDIEEVKQTWKPENMLPRLYRSHSEQKGVVDVPAI